MLARLVVGVALTAVFTSPAAAQRPQIDPVARAWLEAEVPIRWARMVEKGDSLFANGTCRRCHGDGGVGGRRGPSLTDGEWLHGDGGLDSIFETIHWGVRKKDVVDQSRPFDMNPNGGMVIDRDLTRALAAYVWSLSHPSQ